MGVLAAPITLKGNMAKHMSNLPDRSAGEEGKKIALSVDKQSHPETKRSVEKPSSPSGGPV